MRKALYAGSFDPITNGHLYVIEEAAKQNDEVIVYLAVNAGKEPMFSLDERIALAQRAVLEMPNVGVMASEGRKVGRWEYHKLTARQAKLLGAQTLARGIRNGMDTDYERGLRLLNERIEPTVHTSFVMPDSQNELISSSLVKGMAGVKHIRFEGWEEIVEEDVPPNVYNAMLVKRDGFAAEFEQLWLELGATRDFEQAYDTLKAKYTTGQRRHHNWAHAWDVVRELQKVRDKLENPAAAMMAAVGHDAIYEMGSGINELQSGALVRELLDQGGVNYALAKHVARLIEGTDYAHEHPRSNDLDYLADADWAIIGKPWKRFSWYDKDIELEYAHVAPEEFRQRRRAFLAQTAMGPIFRTQEFLEKYHDQAKQNLGRAIDRLA